VSSFPWCTWQNIVHPTFNGPNLISFTNNFKKIKLGFWCHMSPLYWCTCQIPIHTILDELNSLNLLINIEYWNKVDNDKCHYIIHFLKWTCVIKKKVTILVAHSCTFNSLCKLEMDEIYSDNAYTCQIQIVMCNYMSAATCFTQLGKNLVACVAFN
jgi:hypothetical protein